MRRFLWILPLLILLSACQKPLLVETTAFIPATNPQTTPHATEAPSPEEEFARLVLDILLAFGVAPDYSDVKGMKLNATAGAVLRFTLSSCRTIEIKGELTVPALEGLARRLDLLAVLPLEDIELAVTRIADDGLSVFNAFPALRTLSLYQSDSIPDRPVDLSPLSACEYLHCVRLYYLQVANAAPLVALPYLRELQLTGCGLTEIPAALSVLPCLEKLNLTNNRIQSISGQNGGVFQSLTHLSLSSNEIERIETLASFPRLTLIYLSKNKIKDISAFAENSLRFTTISLNSNQITDTSPLSSCFNLMDLNLSHNQITDGTPVAALYAEVLRTRDVPFYQLQGNPLQKLDALPTLIPVEGQKVFTYNGRTIRRTGFDLRDTPFAEKSIVVSYSP